MNALDRAIAEIHASAERHEGRIARIENDRRYRFLADAVAANRVEFHDSDYGLAGFDRIAHYHSSAVSIRYRRARELMLALRAKLYNGDRSTMRKRLALAAELRREETHRRAVETCERNLAAVDRALGVVSCDAPALVAERVAA